MSRRAIAAAYIAATFLAFPQPLPGWLPDWLSGWPPFAGAAGAGAADAVLDLGWLCAWLSPALLLLALRGLSPRRALWRGFALGLLSHAAVLHWSYVAVVRYGHAPVWAGAAAPFAIAIQPALCTAAFGAGAAWLARRGADSPLALAAWWTALDHLRSVLLSGFTWATLGYAQHRNPLLMGLAPWCGVYGLSFATVFCAAALRGRWRAAPGWRGRGLRLAPLLLAAAALHLAGWLGGWAAQPPESGRRLRVAVLQGNIEQGVKWERAWAERTLGIYESLSRRAAAEGAELLLWPETAVPGSLEDPALRARLRSLARETGATLVVGALGVESGGRALRFYDSAYAISKRGAPLRYDKTHLVPFGEYLPFRPLLGRFVRALAQVGGDVTPGARVHSIELTEPALRAGVPICYELLFPNLVRRFAADGAQALLAITNDAWYGRSGAPYQFLAITALRAAETGLDSARAANTGVSALMDGRGRVLQRTAIFERGFLVGELRLRPAGDAGTFYARHGDLFAWSCWLAAAACFALAWRGGRSWRKR